MEIGTDYATTAPILVKKGYNPTPVMGKRPILNGWSNRPPEALMFYNYPNKSVGVLTGGKHNLVAIDVDVTDPICANEIGTLIEETLGSSFRRIGQAPKFLMPFRCTENITKLKTNEYFVSGEKKPIAVEVLAEGQQFVGYGIHPNTKQPYDWPEDSLLDYTATELTEVTAAQLNTFLEQSETILRRYGKAKRCSGVKDLAAALDLSENSKHLDDLKSRAAWHDPMLRLTASYVAKGLAKSEIVSILETYRWPEFSIKQTRQQIGEMVDGARRKDFAPVALERKPQLRTLAALFAEKIDLRDPHHPWITSGFSLLAGSPKAGKSKLLEYIAFEVAKTQRVLFAALEYSVPVAQQRFKSHFEDETVKGNLRLLIEGDIPQMHHGGAEQLQKYLDGFTPALVVIDTLGRLKRPAAEKGYEAETAALSEIKSMLDKSGIDCIVAHHARKKSINDSDDIFERTLGSTALNAVPDTLMMLETIDGLATLHSKGRLITPKQIRLQLKGDKFFELKEAGAQLLGRADRQAEILNLLGEGPLLQTQIAAGLGIDAGNASRFCAALERRRLIKRTGRGQPWELNDV